MGDLLHTDNRGPGRVSAHPLFERVPITLGAAAKTLESATLLVHAERKVIANICLGSLLAA